MTRYTVKKFTARAEDLLTFVSVANNAVLFARKDFIIERIIFIA